MKNEVPAIMANMHPIGGDAEEHLDHHSLNDEAIGPFSAAKKSNEPHKGRTIMIALDNSESSVNALKWAIDNYIHVGNNDLVVLANVREPIISPVYGPGSIYVDFSDYIEKAEEQNRIEAHKLIKKYGKEVVNHFHLQSATGSGLIVKGVVMRGDSRYEILRKAEELKPSILIMGSRGMGAIKRAVLGSVSDYIVHNCDCPVLIVKDERK